MTVLEDKKLRYFGYTPQSRELMARDGDSIYKGSNSDVYHIKKQGTTTFVKADWKAVHISKKWE